MKFRFTENWNKSIINRSLKRKLPTKTIMKQKKNSIKKNTTVKQSSLWSAICPRKRESQTKTIKNSYELKTKKENIKNKSFQTFKYNFDPRKKHKEKKQFFAKLKKNGTKNGTYVPEAFKRSTSNMNKPQKVTTHRRRGSRHPYFRDYERKRDESNDRFLAKLKENARKKGANAKLKKNATKKGANVEPFKRSPSNTKKAQKVTNHRRGLSQRKRDEFNNRDQTMRDGISKSNKYKSIIGERKREQRERRIRRRQRRERKKKKKKKKTDENKKKEKKKKKKCKKV